MGELGHDRFFSIVVGFSPVNSFMANRLALTVVYSSKLKLENYLRKCGIELLRCEEV